MNGTIEEPAPLERAPGLENLTGAELARLAANPKFGQLVRDELAWRRLQNRETQATPPERVFEVQCRGCRKAFEVLLRLPKGVKLSADFPFTCKGCSGSGDQSIVDSPISEFEKQLEGKSPAETAAEWRKNNSEWAAEYKRAKRAGDSYVESRKELMSDVKWEAKLKEFGYVCSTPDCGQPLTLRTAIRWQRGQHTSLFVSVV